MDPEEGFNRNRYRTRVQVVAVIDMLVGTFPFIDLAFAFHDKSLAEIQDREYLVLAWMTILCVYVLQFIMGIWLLAATRECYSEYTVGNCQVWYYIAMFTFVFYIGEMGYAINMILKTPRDQTVKKVMLTMLLHATKIIYRAVSLMTVNNFLYDVCRPVYKYLSQGSFMYTSYYNYRLGIPPPQRRRRLSSVTTQLMIPVRTQPSTSRPKAIDNNNDSTTVPLLPQQAAAAAAAVGATATGTTALVQQHNIIQQPPPPPLPPPLRPYGIVTSPPILVPPKPAVIAATAANTAAIYPPSTANQQQQPLPVYNATKIPHQPLPNYNFYFTYPQPKSKQQYQSSTNNESHNNYSNYYYTYNGNSNNTSTNYMKQPP